MTSNADAGTNSYDADVQMLYDEFADMVYKVAFVQMKNRSDADDIFQEVFIRLVKHAAKLQSKEHAKAWLLRVTINCCKKHFLSMWQRRTIALEDSAELFQSLNEEQMELYDAVAKLPTKYRLVVHLHYYEGYSVQEIAAIVGSRMGTIKSQLFRAREQLRCMWEGGDGNEE